MNHVGHYFCVALFVFFSHVVLIGDTALACEDGIRCNSSQCPTSKINFKLNWGSRTPTLKRPREVQGQIKVRYDEEYNEEYNDQEVSRKRRRLGSVQYEVVSLPIKKSKFSHEVILEAFKNDDLETLENLLAQMSYDERAKFWADYSTAVLGMTLVAIENESLTLLDWAQYQKEQSQSVGHQDVIDFLCSTELFAFQCSERERVGDAEKVKQWISHGYQDGRDVTASLF